MNVAARVAARAALHKETLRRRRTTRAANPIIAKVLTVFQRFRQTRRRGLLNDHWFGQNKVFFALIKRRAARDSQRDEAKYNLSHNSRSSVR